LEKYVKIGDPLDPETTIGPLSMQKQVANLEYQVKESAAKGARVLYGDLGYKTQDSNLQNGYFFHPMVIENITKE
jgi:succinate-semialdehyde dehydrogenase / glutarate-semialdehyde dehydrogenase